MAERHGVDLVLVPYSCHIRHFTFQPRAWRSQAPNYRKPISYSAKTELHVQIWDAQGKLLFERIGRGETVRPFMYTVFKREGPGDDVVRFARRFYAPPLVRSLAEAVVDALKIE